MKARFLLALVFAWCGILSAQAAEEPPLRIFIRAGAKTHGPGQHDHPRFLREWTQLLQQRGAEVAGGMDFPTEQQLARADVLVMYAADAATIPSEQREYLERFLQRGGGMVVIHDAVCGKDPHWFKTVVGGAWEHGHSKWLEGEVGIYFLDQEHPITRGISNFDLKDEIYHDLHMMPEARVLATSFHSVFVIAPQMWVYEKDNYRAFVCLQGHEYSTFNLPHFRAILLRGIAWAGKRDADLFLKEEELNSLKYPEGGPTAPEKAVEKLIIHPEFTMNLVASEPLIEKPISIDWDPAGRLWVAETPEYPNGRRIHQNDRMVALWDENDPTVLQQEKVNRPARDRISYLEDTDGDGVMDKKTVFYEGLELVTSMVFHKDGVIVAQAPDVLWIRDTDGDGKADKVVTILTGFGTFDTHAVINNFRWGMDGWIYGAVGYSGGDPKSGDGKKSFGKHSSAIYRFKPDGSAFEVLASTGCNTWGLDLGWDGEIFYTTPTCGDHALHVVMPETVLARGSLPGVSARQAMQDHNRVFPSVHHTRPAYVQIDVVGGFTAAAGSCVYNGGAWPEKYNNVHFVSEPTVNLVHLDILTPKGVSFVASKEPGREQVEFIGGTDLWFRPVHQRVGPDGALYLLDFYNQAAIHNDTRGPKHGAGNAAVRPDRDHHFGRIWRVQHKEAKSLPPYRLSPEDPAGLVAALEHPNGWVRMTAHRLLSERHPNVAQQLERLLESSPVPAARVHALWLLELSGKLTPARLVAASQDESAGVRKNALRVLADREAAEPERQVLRAALEAVKDSDPRVQLQALITLGDFPATDDVVKLIVDLYPTWEDRYLRSAALGSVAKDPIRFIEAAFAATDPSARADFVAQAVRQLGTKQEAAEAARLIQMLARQPSTTDELKQAALEMLASVLRPDVVPDWSAGLQKALGTFLSSETRGLAGAALPFVARWDRENSLRREAQPVITRSMAELKNASLPDEERARVAANLLGVRTLNPEIVPAVSRILGSQASTELQRRILEALGNTPDPAVGKELASIYGKLRPELTDLAFAQIVRRADWSRALLDAVEEGAISLVTLGPGNVHRLRTHTDRTVASRAIEIVEKIRGPQLKEKQELIARLMPELERPAVLSNGKKLFTENCATCHQFKGEGRDVAPDLTGMGAHGAADLLVHIIDPNRLVEPNYVSVSIETKDDQVFDGIITSENASTITLRNANGDFEIRQDNVLSRRSTGLSLMPEGFEALGPDGLRDLIAFLAADENRFRILDLSEAFTANSTRGIFQREEANNETLRFTKFGLTKVDGVPFEVVHPSRTPNGQNLIVLRGGQGRARRYPNRVEFRAGVTASRLHFLGGVGGWAYPWGGAEHENIPVAKVTLHLAGGGTEEFVLRNGREFADYNGHAEVPGSQEVRGLVRYGQVRWFTKPVRSRKKIERISIEGFDNVVAPTFVAITAELPESSGGEVRTAALAPVPVGSSGGAEEARTLKVLIVGGGDSHDFEQWFHLADSKTLEAAGNVSVEYTDDIQSILPKLEGLDVLYLSNNQPMTNAELRRAIFGFADAGKGLLLVHPALWYNWRDWPEYNRVLVGGGARSHDRYGEFRVTVTEPSHPIMAGLPGEFDIVDELYRFEADPKGSPIRALATGYEKGRDATYPVVWTVDHPTARIVCISLGHDGRAHQHPAFRKLLMNSLNWVAKRPLGSEAKP